MLDVTVITPALPSRVGMLGNLVRSVREQTVPPVAHLVCFDYDGSGPGTMMNIGLRAVESEWTFVIADDDVLYPNHFEEFSKCTEDADVVYSLPEQVGHPPDVPPAYDGPFDPSLLFNRLDSGLRGSFMARTDLVRDLGGWEEGIIEDWKLLCRLVEHGARFRKVPVKTWEYRYHGDSVSAYLRAMNSGMMPDGVMDTYLWKDMIGGARA